MLEGGRVRVCPIVKQPCWTYEFLRQELTQALGRWAVGSSSVHNQSSRTHVVLELEVVCQALVDTRQAEKAEHEARVAAAEDLVDNILKSSASPCLGAKMVFVDLAGAEYEEKGYQLQPSRQTPQERQEGRQINTDLPALKEVIRAWSKNQTRNGSVHRP